MSDGINECRDFDVARVAPPKQQDWEECRIVAAVAAGMIAFDPDSLASSLAATEEEARRHTLDTLDDTLRYMTDWTTLLEDARARLRQALVTISTKEVAACVSL